jgi:hypothetical protein
MLSTAEVAQTEVWSIDIMVKVENIELICMIGTEEQVSVKLPLDNAGVAETYFTHFVEQLGAKVGEVYTAAEAESTESKKQEREHIKYPH